MVLAVAANLAVLALSACFLFHLRKQAEREKYRRELLLLPWLLGSLAVVVAMSLSTRMGCCVHLFGIPLLASVSWRAGGSAARAAGAAILLASAAVGAAFLAHDLGPETQRQARCSRAARQLVAALKASNGRYDRVYLVNDAVSISGVRWLREFAGLKAELVVVNELDNLPDARNTAATEVARKGPTCRISVQLAGRLRFLLRSTSQAGMSEEHPVIRRSDNFVYEFPKFTRTHSRTGAFIYTDLGSMMDVRFRDDGRYAVLFYDSASDRYTIK